MDPTGGSFIDLFAQYGPLGGFALSGLYFFLIVYRRESARADQAEERLRLLEKEMRDQLSSALPVIVKATEATADILDYLRRGRRE